MLLTGGEKDYIESLPSCYLFKFKEDINGNFSAEGSQKADMINKRRAHSLIYFNITFLCSTFCGVKLNKPLTPPNPSPTSSNLLGSTIQSEPFTTYFVGA